MQGISVIIPARNAAPTIARTLRSLAPTRDAILEILLVDDGSADATAEIAAGTAATVGLSLRVVRSPSAGPGGARNLGLDEARGETVYFLDADDEVLTGGLESLSLALQSDPSAGLAVGAAVRRTHGRPDKTKVPQGYFGDAAANVRRYLRNELWPIAIGSTLIRRPAALSARFPETFGLDEDTCYFAALLARSRVVSVNTPVLLYHHDEARMARRFLEAPAVTLAAISAGLDRLAEAGIGPDEIGWRKAWIALRIARELLRHGRYDEAAAILPLASRHPDLERGWKVRQYAARIGLGLLRQRLAGRRRGPVAQQKPGAARRILIVTVDPAADPVSGSDLRNWQNAVAAAEMGDVALASLRPAKDRAEPFRILGLSRADDAKGRGIESRRSRIGIRITQVALQRLLALVRAFRPDTIVLEGVHLSGLISHLRPLVPTLVLDMHNVESELVAGRPGLFWRRSRESGRIFRHERRALAGIDRVWCCSVEDAARLERLHRPGIPVHIVPNGVPRPETLQPAASWPRLVVVDSPVILLTGHLGYAPNVEAAFRLIDRIMPAIRSDIPDARLVLAGRFPAQQLIDAAASPDVELLANPSDLAGLFARADLAIVPLETAGGTRIKILEAMARGLPVLATSLAAEGLGLAPGYDVTLAESDAALAGEAVALLRDPARRELQRKRAAETVMRRFGPDTIAAAVHAGLHAGPKSEAATAANEPA